ncbi:spermidine acetyltransferase [Tissierella sp. P1]|jgi:diamine N-acetyltransferase|uniref:GNAT family N-acetyltransferase n=1 Tax=unclassified Tissierella TaxID=2638726 RepID=UPI000B9FBBAA|nr:GNAT family N-acetyltransferase [Tissierella sp. P1]MDU5082976.1 GNAT family N-acetyltransferase [Bacillota bacterium]OZV11009.1 spermidine acetyltransferase [Tissierella sp. P1]
MLKLINIDSENFWEIIKLKVTKQQEEFVASNTFSIAQSKVQPECIPLAIYNDETPIGFLMYCIDSIDKEYWIYRIMIDIKYQSKGYGRQAMELLINRIKEDKKHHVIFISFEPENEWAKALYESMGFTPDGRVVEGEIVYKLEY